MHYRPSPRPSIHNSSQNKEVSCSPPSSPKSPKRKQKPSSDNESDSSCSDHETKVRSLSPSTSSQKLLGESLNKSNTSTYDSPEKVGNITNRSSSVFPYESFTPECYKPVKQNNTCATKSHSYQIISLMVIILGIVIIYSFVPIGGTSEKIENVKKTCSFEDLKRKFTKEDEYLWQSLQVGTDQILNNDIATPAVYLFLHAGKSSTRKLIDQVVSKAAYCFDPTLKHLELGSKDFTSNETKNDYGVLVEKYKNEIKEGGVLLIVNLNEIPGEAARALHAICDIYSPIVPRVMIFMTLIVSEKPNAEENAVELAERTLMDLWGSKIKRSELDPLITRVTDQVFHLKSD